MEHQPQTVRVLYGNGSNFTRVRDVNEFQHYYERPLLVEAWAQTTLEDFDLVDDVHRQRNIELQKEVGALREKIRVLEEDLSVHVQLLNQIHATAALKSIAPRPETEFITPTPTPPVTPITQHQNAQQHHFPKRISPTASKATRTYHSNHGPELQVINTVQMKVEGPHAVSTTDSVKYTIVSGEENDNNNCEPIEIQLAEEDGAINLNTSADSGRLEICLSADEQPEQPNISNEPMSRIVKQERQQTNSPPLPPLPAQSGILVKRRKLTDNSQENSQQETKYFYNGYSSNVSSTSSVICQQIPNEIPTSTLQMTRSRPPSRVSSEITFTTTMPNQVLPNPVRHHSDENVMVSIGPNNTRVPYKLYESINWESPSIATRKLLMAVFDRQTLATHSMTGKPSPAFRGQSKPQKKRLDPSVTEDIVFVVTRRCKVSDKEVRNAITTKCADENKMMKLQMNKNRSLRESNKENLTNGTDDSNNTI